jgi:3-hydroxyisobutyrate dehydrogenase-like beta-hydroxyacid dehydrogenase
MPNIADLLTLAFAGLGIIGILAAAATIARSSSIKQHLELLRGEVADLSAAHARSEGENVQLRKRVEQMAAEAKILSDLVTSRADVAQVAAEMRGLTQMVHRDYTAIMALFYRNPDDVLEAQEGRRRGNPEHEPPQR